MRVSHFSGPTRPSWFGCRLGPLLVLLILTCYITLSDTNVKNFEILQGGGKQLRLEAAGSSGAVQGLRMENDAALLLARMRPPLIPRWSNWTLRPRTGVGLPVCASTGSKPMGILRFGWFMPSGFIPSKWPTKLKESPAGGKGVDTRKQSRQLNEGQ
jgi:hypothetical protein